MRYLEQRNREGMSPGPIYHALGRINQDDGQIGRGSTSHHIPGVLDGPVRICDNELWLRSGKVAVC